MRDHPQKPAVAAVPWGLLQSSTADDDAAEANAGHQVLLYAAHCSLYLHKSAVNGRRYLRTKQLKLRERLTNTTFGEAFTISSGGGGGDCDDGPVINSVTLAASADSLPLCAGHRLLDGQTLALGRHVSYQFHHLASQELREHAPLEGYRLIGRLGTGAFGYVLKAYRSGERRLCALKILRPEYLGAEYERETVLRPFRNERTVLERLRCCPCVVRAHGYREQSPPGGAVFLELQLCQGGSLLDQLLRDDLVLRESHVRLVFCQVLAALGHLHRLGVTHRDVKPGNVLYLSRDGAAVKLADFGLASDERFMRDGVGTLAYAAPELVGKFREAPEARSGAYTCAVDVWSCAVALFYALANRFPFGDRGQEAAYAAAVCANRVDFAGDRWRHRSFEAQAVIASVLRPAEAERRPTAVQMLEHAWFEGADEELRRSRSR